jgi:hypothetical protein
LITLRDYLPVPGTVVLDTYNFGGNVSVLRIFQEEISSCAGVSSKPFSSRSQNFFAAQKTNFMRKMDAGFSLNSDFQATHQLVTREKAKTQEGPATTIAVRFSFRDTRMRSAQAKGSQPLVANAFLNICKEDRQCSSSSDL